MNEFLYGYKDMDSLKEKLSKIESGNLLQNDLDILYKVMDSPTDYELAMNVKVHEIYNMELTDDGYLVNADLNWLMRGYDGEFNLIRNYNIKCIEADKQLYLAKLTIQNDIAEWNFVYFKNRNPQKFPASITLFTYGEDGSMSHEEL